MKLRIPVLFLLITVVSVSGVNASVLSRLLGAGGNDLQFLDESREEFVDVDGSGTVSAGDVLRGFARVDSSNPPATPGGNEIYAVFSQQFAGPITATAGPGGSVIYGGSFVPTVAGANSLSTLTGTAINANAYFAIMDAPGGFSFDATTVAPPAFPTFASILAGLAAEGTVRLSAGNRDAGDFFVFQTSGIGGGSPIPDFVSDVSLIPTISNSLTIGNFDAGLSILDNFYGSGVVSFSDTIPAFSVFGPGGSTMAEFVLNGGNFGGTNLGGGTRVQGGLPSFVDNADATVHPLVNTTVPEATSVLAWCGLAMCAGVFCVLRSRKSAVA